jgi:uncharacterized protein (DUF1778 family)
MHQHTYGHCGSTRSNLLLSHALINAHRTLRNVECRLIEEEKRLDRRLEEYRQMMQALDGPKGSFAQVVEDWTDVRKETEECRKDLMRLGWTADHCTN